MTVRILALVGDAYGARGGIARYNRDLFGALAATGAEILVLPRLGTVSGEVLPRRCAATARQVRAAELFARRAVGRLALSARGRRVLRACLHGATGCRAGALAWCPLLAANSRCRDLARSPQPSCVGPSRRADQVTAVSRGTRTASARLGRSRARTGAGIAQHCRRAFCSRPGLACVARAPRSSGPARSYSPSAACRPASATRAMSSVFAALPELRRRLPSLVYAVAGEGDDRARLEARRQ